MDTCPAVVNLSNHKLETPRIVTLNLGRNDLETSHADVILRKRERITSLTLEHRFSETPLSE